MKRTLRLNLDSLIINEFEVNPKNIDIILLQAFYVFRCQCARLIHDLLHFIRKNIELLESQQLYLDTEVGIPLLINLRKNINLTINILFKFNDLFPI